MNPISQLIAALRSGEFKQFPQGFRRQHDRIKMRSLLLVSIIAASACSNQAYIHKTVEDPIGAPSWVADALYNAAEFWEQHEGVYILISDTGDVDIKLEELLPKYFGVFYGNGVGGGGQISIDDSLGENFIPAIPICTMTHEIGHSLGMDHANDETSLMSPQLELTENNDCYWSNTDRALFCKATGQDCDGSIGVMAAQLYAQQPVEDSDVIQ